MTAKAEKLIRLGLQNDGGVYSWQAAGFLWAKAGRTGKQNLFSRQGLSAESVKIEAHRPGPLTLHNALLWNGRHCFLTAIDQKTPVLVEITAALTEPVICTKTVTTVTKGPDKMPVYGTGGMLSFPAVLTEKYTGFTQQEPMARTETTFILVTPKEIMLEVNDLIQTGGGGRYAVRSCHLLDEYKNEYEITRKGDV